MTNHATKRKRRRPIQVMRAVHHRTKNHRVKDHIDANEGSRALATVKAIQVIRIRNHRRRKRDETVVQIEKNVRATVKNRKNIVVIPRRQAVPTHIHHHHHRHRRHPTLLRRHRHQAAPILTHITNENIDESKLNKKFHIYILKILAISHWTNARAYLSSNEDIQSPFVQSVYHCFDSLYTHILK